MPVHFKRLSIVFCVLLLAASAGCASRSPASANCFAMDTYCSLTAHGKQAVEALSAAEAELYRLDSMFSRTSETSPVSDVNRQAGAMEVCVPEELYELIASAAALSERTGGAFDSTVAPLMNLWDFKSESPRVPDLSDIQKLLPLVGWENVQLSQETNVVRLLLPGMQIDLGGIAKGYASERLAAMMREYGVSSALLSLGGNIAAVGQKPDGTPWQVGVQDPRNPEKIIGIISAEDCFLITSGDYQRGFFIGDQRYHHILDPETGYPAARGLISATVVSKDGTSADALSTALIVRGTEGAIDLWRASDDFEAVLVTEDGRVLVTEGLSEQFAFRGEEAGYALQIVEQ